MKLTSPKLNIDKKGYRLGGEYQILSSESDGFTTSVVSEGKNIILKWYYDNNYLYYRPIPNNKTTRLYFEKSE